MKVKEILNNKRRQGQILSVDAADSVSTAIAMMVQNDTGSVAVFSEKKFSGMLTFREILQALNECQDSSCFAIKVGTLMDAEPSIATPEDSVDQIRNLMTSRHIRYLPVFTEGNLTDVISFYDVARTVAKEADFENRMLKQYIAHWPETIE